MICGFNCESWSPLPDLNRSQGVSPDLLGLLHDLAKNAKREMNRGNSQAVEELLQVFLEIGEEFSTFEKNSLENDKGSEPFEKPCKGLPFVAEGSQ